MADQYCLWSVFGVGQMKQLMTGAPVFLQSYVGLYVIRGHANCFDEDHERIPSENI